MKTVTNALGTIAWIPWILLEITSQEVAAVIAVALIVLVFVQPWITIAILAIYIVSAMVIFLVDKVNPDGFD